MVNCSPKGLDTLRILNNQTLAYLDLTGSGAETIAHLKENGRFVVMFCSFSNKPLILRLHGVGEVLEVDHPEFEELAAQFPTMRGTRSIIRLHVKRIADSCGWGVPRYEFVEERDTYGKFVANITDDQLRESQKQSNLKSLDGIPALSKPTV